MCIKAIKLKAKQKGTSLIEIVVVCSIIALVLAGVTVVLLRNIQESRVSGTLSDLNAISLAMKSADLRGELIDANTNGDYFDDLVEKKYISKVPSILPGATYRVLTSTTQSGVVVYYVSVDCDGDVCLRTVKALDEKVDFGDGPSSGQVQWIE